MPFCPLRCCFFLLLLRRGRDASLSKQAAYSQHALGGKKKKKGLIHQNSYGSPKQEVLRYHEQEYFAENEKNEPFLWHDVNSFANAMRNGVRECVSEVCASQTCVSQTHLSVTCTGSIWKQFDAINMSITSIVIITG